MKTACGTMYSVDDMKASVASFRKLLGVTPRLQNVEWTELPIGAHGPGSQRKELRFYGPA